MIFELTMGKAQGLTSKKRTCMTPFIYTKEEFPENAATQMIETTENGSKLKLKMHLLNGVTKYYREMAIVLLK